MPRLCSGHQKVSWLPRFRPSRRPITGKPQWIALRQSLQGNHGFKSIHIHIHIHIYIYMGSLGLPVNVPFCHFWDKCFHHVSPVSRQETRAAKRKTFSMTGHEVLKAVFEAGEGGWVTETADDSWLGDLIPKLTGKPTGSNKNDVTKW